MTPLLDEARTAVLVGCGQLTQREPDPARALSPIELTAQAARLAAEDSGAGARLLAALDTVVAIRSFSDTSWRFACPFGRLANPPASLARRLGAASATRLVYTHAGGNMPQWTVNRLVADVAAGRCAAALVAGGEALATQKAAQRAGLALDWSEDAGGEPQLWGVERRGWSDVEDAHGMRGAIYAYPLFENAIRGALGRTIDAHRGSMGALLERFARVAAANPLADRRQAFSADEIAQPRAGNPYVGFPYTRLMNANAFIDQAAAVLVTSVATARRLGIPRDRWVYLHGCADADDHWLLAERRDFHSAPAMAAVLARALEAAGVGVGELASIDLYSCFPSAVELACEALGLSPDDPRGLTVTGGLAYFGGPGNNYVTHSIAKTMERVRTAPGSRGLVTAVGNYLTKHSAGVYSSEPPARPFVPGAPGELQRALDAVRSPPFVGVAHGDASVETYTVMHERDGRAWGLLYGRLAGGERFVANTPPEAALLARMQEEDFLGRSGRVTSDGTRNVFEPR